MRNYIIACFCITLATSCLGQDSELQIEGYTPSAPYSSSSFNFGLGIGMDYGGIGTRLEALPSSSVGLYLGLGYNLVGLGYNGGVSFKLAPKKRVCPTLNLMYGYNAVIKVIGASEYDKSYYGPSMGFGVMFRSRRAIDNFFNLELFIPFRSSEFEDDLDALQSNPGIEISEPFPVTISVGYHFGSH